MLEKIVFNKIKGFCNKPYGMGDKSHNATNVLSDKHNKAANVITYKHYEATNLNLLHFMMFDDFL